MVQFLRGQFVHGNKMRAPAALDRAQARMFVRERTVERAEQKTAEPSARWRSTAHSFLLHDVLEKNLRQILGVIAIVSAPAEVAVNWRPISLAKLRHRFVG